LEQATKDEVQTSLGAQTVLSAVVLHYDNIDFQAVDESFTDGRSDEELDALEQAGAIATDALIRLVSPKAMLQCCKEDQELSPLFLFFLLLLYTLDEYYE
jgi:hypothetical protein